ncbi:Co-chaperone HscB, C-terminal oligomerization domain-containing protein [Boeremia exigua]|uniref:Co-chaperone HscB, C-terminal oligomerization domain-containing protein n=1 Tax=Boeremia exigua TaxID=749465 RepID=UPI001E8DBD2D|nr:Co-chaperone HscB, C-terminal oligomerization domain-containing protein [Boeremia exigua]KAH6638114.1 Co-chaperone HscB, C-terminal oligomerization domain-containing protein [Boeremia exigua]
MHTIRPTAARALRAASTSGAYRNVQSTATPCLFCAHRALPQRPSRRYQSTSNAREDSFKAQPALQQLQTHYSFFPKSISAGPPPEGPFTLDLNALKREFLQLQAKAHPDLHPQEDKKRAEATSARINEAYKTLQSPLHRAQYLLSQRGIETAEDETAKVDDPELLMEVLEAREQIEEAESEEDLIGMKDENEGRIQESIKALEEAFAKDDVELAKSETVKLRYWMNINESIANWEKGKPIVLEH